ncbi:MAG: serine/threonine phosphatase [Trichormus sp. ATA11-4-KO1]|nr:serine/threonine phosphatase [Trichormus sp. ATA11-4-KO1]
MLICPQCTFENPDTNKFCQNCGASLTHKVCPECSTDVPVNAQLCHNCGAECGTVWQAIITQDETRDWELGSGEEIAEKTTEQENQENSLPLASTLEETLKSPILATQLTAGSYLDQEQRYQLLELPSAPRKNVAKIEVCVRVLDCQPYQISPVEAILTNQQQGLVVPSVEAGGIPSLAKAYIDLQSLIHPGIPPIHDAWQQDDMQVVLIEDRSHWQSLLDLWRDETTDSLQILHWLYQMTQLWAVLETVNCRQSLLDLANLRVDEDQTLALQRLYVEPLNKQPAIPADNLANASSEDEEKETFTGFGQTFTIQALGQVWQELFRQSQRTQFGSIVQTLEDVELGKIQTVEQLRSRLTQIAAELETPITATFHPMEEKDPVTPTILQLDELEDSAVKPDDLPTVVLSMQLSSLEDAGRTDVGRQRNHNEDCFGIETKIEKLELPKNRVIQARGLYILCDGMGGHAGGEIASELAVKTVRQYFQEHWITNQMPTSDSIREAVYLANQAIYETNQQDARSGIGRMGTTLVMLLIQGTQAAVAHVGDSRLYCLTRKRGLVQITVDHEVGQREISRGVEANIAYARPDAYQLTQALGPRDQNSINPDVEFFEINEDSLFILVSDGLSDNDLLEIHGQTHLIPLLSSGANLEQGVMELIDLANQYNGHDNITAVLIRAKVRPNMDS